MRFIPTLATLFLLGPTLAATAQVGPLQVEPSKTAAPDSLKAPVKEALNAESLQIKNADGKPFASVWLRSAIPASAKPAGPKGTILFPFLTPGELIGAFEFAVDGQDYRDQLISPGVYTLRYGLQPVNGDHLGVSKYRDYLLLVPAGKDPDVATIPQKKLDKTSTEASETNHPAVMILFAAPEGSDGEPKMIHDQELDLWGVILKLSLKVEGETATITQPVQLIVSGAAMP